MITIPDDYAKLLLDVCNNINSETDGQCCRHCPGQKGSDALYEVISDILTHSDTEDWYYNLEYANKIFKTLKEEI